MTLQKTTWIDLAQVEVPLDQEDAEIMEIFRNRREHCNDMLLGIREDKTACILRKDDAARMKKQTGSLLNAIVTLVGYLLGLAGFLLGVTFTASAWVSSLMIITGLIMVNRFLRKQEWY